ncbi:MAG: outer membrane protein transport protein [Thermodesulfobacteriota bacterium]
MRPRPQAKRGWFFLIACFLLITFAHDICLATLFEDLAVCSKAISLANTCTAYPPDQLSIHYNPAGLSDLHDGLYLSQGLLTAEFAIKSKFKADPDFPGWLGGIHSGSPGDPNYYDYRPQADPVNGQSGTTQGVHLYIPLMGPQDMDSVGMPTPFGFSLAAAPFPFGLSYRKPNTRWTFGFGVYAPAMGGYYRDDDDPARYNGREVSMQHIVYAAPAVSYQLSDTVSVGVTMGLGQGATQLDTDMRLPNDMTALTEIMGISTQGLNIPIISQLTLPPPWFGGGVGPWDDIGNLDLQVRDDYTPNYNLGLMWHPRNWLSFGLCYKSEVKMEQEGTFRFTYSEEFQRFVAWMGSSPLLLAVSNLLDLPYRATPSQNGSVYMKGMDLPQRLEAGVMVRPTRKLRLLCDLHWIDYSNTRAYTIQFDQDVQPLMISKFVGHLDGNDRLILEMNMKDETHVSLGAEYQLLDWLALRCGWEDRKTSIDMDYFSVLAPLPDTDYYGVGMGLNFKSGLKVDLAAGFLTGSWRVPNNGSKNLNSTDFINSVYNPYGGMDVSGSIDATILSANFSMPFKYLYRVGQVLRKTGRDIKDQIPFLNKPVHPE